jgi:hypothetical protein
MYSVLRILLHRPFVSDNDLHSSPSNAINSFLVCATAAKEIVRILRAYDSAFSIQRAPYLISYATYVSATIHVRIAAQREPGSEAHICLATCLDVFEKNQETNWAVRRANGIINNLMKRMNVSISESDINALTLEQEFEYDNHGQDNIPFSERVQPLTEQTIHNDRDQSLDHTPRITNSHDGTILSPSNTRQNTHVTSDLDIDAIIQSFICEQEIYAPSTYQGAEDTVTFYDTTTSAQPRINNEWNNTSGTYMSTEMTLQPPLLTQLSQPPGDNGYGMEYVQQSHQNPFSANDMLFGFNSSAMEGIGWELEDMV